MRPRFSAAFPHLLPALRPLACLLIPALLAPGTAAETMVRLTSGSASLTLLSCADPNPPRCLVFSESDRHECEPCNAWTLEVLGAFAATGFAARAYGYDKGLPRGNVFLSDVAEQVHGVEFPRTEHDWPITIADFAERAEESGWIPVHSATPVPGSIAVDRSFGGFVEATDQDSGALLVYPSDRHRGELRKSPVNSVLDAQAVQYYVPERALVAPGP